MKAKARCENPNDDGYRFYGARGVKFMLPPFPEFFAALGERPYGWEMDRINPYGHYELSNVRWTPPNAGAVRAYRRMKKYAKMWM
jgi:hypothetical protein